MKGSLTLKILEKVEGGIQGAADLVAVFLQAGYGASHGRVEYLLSKRQWNRERAKTEQEKIFKLRRRCYSFFQSLKRDGLVEGDFTSPELTSKGHFKIKELRRRNEESLPTPTYLSEKSEKVIFVIFDIPEERRRKRAWLRSVLKNLGFEMVQKSVWRGKVKIPKALLRDLERFSLMSCVEIFEATKLGTLS